MPPETRVLDGNEGTVRQLGRRLEGGGLLLRHAIGAERYALSFNIRQNEREIVARAEQLLRIPE